MDICEYVLKVIENIFPTDTVTDLQSWWNQAKQHFVTSLIWPAVIWGNPFLLKKWNYVWTFPFWFWWCWWQLMIAVVIAEEDNLMTWWNNLKTIHCNPWWPALVNKTLAKGHHHEQIVDEQTFDLTTFMWLCKFRILKFSNFLHLIMVIIIINHDFDEGSILH